LKDEDLMMETDANHSACKECGFAIKPGDAFCGNCGHAVGSQQKAAGRPVQVLIAAGLIIFIVGLSWFFFFRDATPSAERPLAQPRNNFANPTPAMSRENAPQAREYATTNMPVARSSAPDASAANRGSTIVAPQIQSAGDGAFARATQMLLAKDYSGAENEFRKAVQYEPGRADFHKGLGKALAASGKYGAAELEFKEAVRRDAQSEDALLGLAEAFAWQNKWPEAENPYASCLRINPNNIRAHIGLGTVFFRRNDFARAETEYRDALRLDPVNGQCHVELAGALYMLGRKQEAMDSARKSLQLGFSADHWVLRELKLHN
jgi:tetratricopeptide (TPR) repeat protein